MHKYGPENFTGLHAMTSDLGYKMSANSKICGVFFIILPYGQDSLEIWRFSSPKLIGCYLTSTMTVN